MEIVRFITEQELGDDRGETISNDQFKHLTVFHKCRENCEAWPPIYQILCLFLNFFCGRL